MPYGLQHLGVGVDRSGWDEAAENVTQEESDVKTVQNLIRRLQKNVRRARNSSYIIY